MVLPVESGVPFLTFYPATILAFYICGRGPGWLVMGLCIFTGYYIFSPPFWSFEPTRQGVIATLLFSASSILMAWIVQRLEAVSMDLEQSMVRLRINELRLHTVLEDQTEAICRFKTDGTVLYVNEAFCSMFGMSRDEIVGRSWQPVAVEEDRAMIAQRLSLLSPQNPTVTIEKRVYTHGGGVRWGQFVNRGIYDDRGELQEIQAVGRDIHDQKLLEAKLAITTERLLDLYDHAPCGYHSIDANGIYVEINATALSWIGYERDEVIGLKSPKNFFTEEGLRDYHHSFEVFKRTGKMEGLEFDMLHRNGSVRRVAVNSTAIRDEAGNFKMSRTVLIDVGALRRAEDQMRRLMHEQAAMLDNELVGIIKLRNRREVWHNKAILRMFGYSSEELSGASARLLYPDDASFVALGSKAYPVLQAGGHFRAQLELSRKDGERLWIDMSGTLVSVEREESMWLLLDITSLKRAEALKLAAVQIEAENRQLREASQLKGYFLSTMSHELRTPLNAVLGFTELLKSRAVGPESPKYDLFLGHIGTSGKHLLQLIDQTLDLARIESGNLVFNPEPAHLSDLIAEALAIHHDESVRRNLVITAEIEPSVNDVTVDVLRLRQMLSNYVGNAVKFTPEGGQVVVRTMREDSTNFRVEVEDTGIGISATDIQRLFKGFQQLDERSDRKFQGAGLGLAVTHRLAEAQGGSVGCRSQVGKGSTFHFVLPLFSSAASG
jgi:PAS domain S-box-containing protein